MKLILVTTTIHVPKVLELYRKFGSDVEFIVVGDKKTPHEEIKRFLGELGSATYYDEIVQKTLGYECSEIIGWNKIARRNIGILEALRFGEDAIISVNDDDIPLRHDYFQKFTSILGSNFSGIKVRSESSWFNTGQFLLPPVYHRGFPPDERGKDSCTITSVVDAKVGVAEGLVLGDPDIDAIERIISNPKVSNFSNILVDGVVIEQSCLCPFNNENTAYIRELAPLMLCPVDVGRPDDIIASLIAERVMAETDYHVHYGQPAVWQNRNTHNLLTDFRDEFFGSMHLRRFGEDLWGIQLSKGSIVDILPELYAGLVKLDYLSRSFMKLSNAWLKDLDAVL